jgi:hypothetical protein
MAIPKAVKMPVLEDVADKLMALLQSGTPAPDAATDFAALIGVVESLPLPSAEYCFVVNWLTSAAGLAQGGDANTAAYQLTVVLKKLRQWGYTRQAGA